MNFSSTDKILAPEFCENRNEPQRDFISKQKFLSGWVFKICCNVLGCDCFFISQSSGKIFFKQYTII